MKVRYLLDTGMMGHFINRRRGVDVRVREIHLRGASNPNSTPDVFFAPGNFNCCNLLRGKAD
jgi:hypothetical protein